eukprot:TRINITY_DN3174_c0_g1_i2.p1 TRINITY_DN3174_c0_g1~~TRINITY_DN3174_c0_g1_i2.p1  ORF type:complete len:210 (-),score=9.14 TRINITY_DN3174_c0_g1_i2:97-726(-)
MKAIFVVLFLALISNFVAGIRKGITKTKAKSLLKQVTKAKKQPGPIKCTSIIKGLTYEKALAKPTSPDYNGFLYVYTVKEGENNKAYEPCYKIGRALLNTEKKSSKYENDAIERITAQARNNKEEYVVLRTIETSKYQNLERLVHAKLYTKRADRGADRGRKPYDGHSEWFMTDLSEIDNAIDVVRKHMNKKYGNNTVKEPQKCNKVVP